MKTLLAIHRPAILALLAVLAPACDSRKENEETTIWDLMELLSETKASAGSPSLRITAPTSAPDYLATADVVEIAGQAADPSGISAVTWTNATTGWTGRAEGTTSWRALIPLAPGENLVEVKVTNVLGGTTTDSILIAR